MARNPPSVLLMCLPFIVFVLAMVLCVFLNGCVLGEKVGYNNEPKRLDEQIQDLVTNPPQSSSGWVYAFLGIGATIFGLWVKNRLFPSSPQLSARMSSIDNGENKVFKATKDFLNGMLK